MYRTYLLLHCVAKILTMQFNQISFAPIFFKEKNPQNINFTRLAKGFPAYCFLYNSAKIDLSAEGRTKLHVFVNYKE